MNWFIKKLADESTYFPMFLGTLTIYACACVAMIVVSSAYHPQDTIIWIAASFIGSVMIGVVARLAHVWAYNKVVSSENNDTK